MMDEWEVDSKTTCVGYDNSQVSKIGVVVDKMNVCCESGQKSFNGLC